MGLISLSRALRLPPNPRLALVGSGGKTTALFRIARQLPPPVLVTTTTHLGVSQAVFADRHFILTSSEDLEELMSAPPDGVILLTGLATKDDRLEGLSPDLFDRVASWAETGTSGSGLPLLVEADGSRLRPLKAPGEHEPAIPRGIDHVVVSAGLWGLGQPISQDWVHRPERFAALSGLEIGSPITVEALSQVLRHPLGGLKNIPEDARRSLLLNGADTSELQAQAARLANQLQASYDSILIASLSPGQTAEEDDSNPHEVWAVHERIAGVILAAGAARRFGQAKLLLPWHGEPLVRHVVRTALKAGLSPVVVVVGAEMEAVRAAVDGLGAEVIYNPDWEAGQSTSLRTGLLTLPPSCGGAVFLLGDQPQIPPRLVRALIEAHAEGLPALTAPLVDGQRGNPVLFDRDLFPELLALTGDTGGRALFSRYPVSWVTWHDPAPLLDVDTPEDYSRLMELE